MTWLMGSVAVTCQGLPAGKRSVAFRFATSSTLSYFPDVGDEKAQLALALMREGRGLNHPGYAFLSFYKILETEIPKGCKAHRLDIRV